MMSDAEFQMFKELGLQVARLEVHVKTLEEKVKRLERSIR